MYARFLQLRDGRVLLTFTVRSNSTDGHSLGLRAILSSDEGQTWKSCIEDGWHGFMVGYLNDGHMGHLTCEEPVIAELKDGRILCFMRSTCGRILKSYSEDGGEHWMKVQATDIAMSNSPCAL